MSCRVPHFGHKNVLWVLNAFHFAGIHCQLYVHVALLVGTRVRAST